MVYVPSLVSCIPSFDHVTEVAGEPVETHSRVNGELMSSALSSDVMEMEAV